MKCCIVGKFESFHKGHQLLIEEARKRCKKVVVVSIRKWEKELFSEKERELLAKQFGVDLVHLDFKEIKDLSPEEFFVKLKDFGCKKLFAGEDWHFGKGRIGNPETAKILGKRIGIEVVIVPIRKEENRKIGTSIIKELLSSGKVEKANKLLGFNYFVIGKVKEGKKLGREIGFPTINVEYEKKIFLPYGVFEVVLKVDGKTYKGIANFGKKPTVEEGKNLETLEVHIPDENLPPLYGKEVKVEFLKFLRPEKKFSSIEELKKQIKLDVENLKKYWRDKVGRAENF
jgi:riboflavin kinase/FMN adenylyltransferase